MTTKHTPGEWTLLKSEYADGDLVNAGGIIIQQFTDTTIAGLKKRNEKSELNANAHLIAAAPELLEALKELVAINQVHNEEISKIIGRPVQWKDDYLNKAKSAISKAEDK